MEENNEKAPETTQNQQKMDIKELQQFMKKNQSNPVLLGYMNNGGAFCFAGTFSLEQLCFLKEVLNRKINSMLDPAIQMGVEPMPKKKMPELKQVGGVDVKDL